MRGKYNRVRMILVSTSCPTSLHLLRFESFEAATHTSRIGKHSTRTNTYLQVTHCGSSRVSTHAFSNNNGKNWTLLSNPTIEPYKPVVTWDDTSVPQTFSSMERPHAYFDPVSGDMTHLAVAAPLDIGDEGCADGRIGREGCKAKRPPCPCCNCKYLSHAGTVLITLHREQV